MKMCIMRNVVPACNCHAFVCCCLYAIFKFTGRPGWQPPGHDVMALQPYLPLPCRARRACLPGRDPPAFFFPVFLGRTPGGSDLFLAKLKSRSLLELPAVFSFLKCLAPPNPYFLSFARRFALGPFLLENSFSSKSAVGRASPRLRHSFSVSSWARFSAAFCLARSRATCLANLPLSLDFFRASAALIFFCSSNNRSLICTHTHTRAHQVVQACMQAQGDAT